MTVVIVNYKTLELTRTCVRSVLTTYPGIRMVLVDNGSKDASTAYVRILCKKSHRIECILNERNLTHGPALHQGILAAKTPYVFTLDSDCVVRKGSFLQIMLRMFGRDPQLYAVGRLELVNSAGIARKGGSTTGFISHVHPCMMLLDREKYLQLPPFEHRGSPAVTNMRAVPKHNWKLANFQISTYIRHLKGGTREQFAGRWDPAHSQKREPEPKPKAKPESTPELESAAKPERTSDAGSTAVLIPTYNGVEHVKRCVRALLRVTKAPCRVYIADACSSDAELHKYLTALENAHLVTIFRSAERKDFPTINNWAARQIPASEDICFLNSDTEPTKGWLTRMVQVLLTNARVGLVGARLIYPEHKGAAKGKLQHAGVARTTGGAPYHIFRNKPAAYAQANRRLEINAVTAACMLVRRSVWEQLNGFDEGFVGGHFEDVDFCWRARRADWKIVYQPEALLYHYEHGSGRELVREASGRNLRRLKEKWPEMTSDEYLFA